MKGSTFTAFKHHAVTNVKLGTAVQFYLKANRICFMLPQFIIVVVVLFRF